MGISLDLPPFALIKYSSTSQNGLPEKKYSLQEDLRKSAPTKSISIQIHKNHVVAYGSDPVPLYDKIILAAAKKTILPPHFLQYCSIPH